MATGLYIARGQPQLPLGKPVQLITLVREVGDLPGPVLGALDAAGLVLPHVRGLHREAFFAMPMNSRSIPLGLHQVSIGTVDGAPVHPREVFLPAILAGATRLIVLHNHPSGDPTPSREDCEVTDRLRAVGELLGIELLDHLILGDSRLFSFTAGGELSL